MNKELFVFDRVDKHFQKDLRITIIQSTIEQKEYLINNEQKKCYNMKWIISILVQNMGKLYYN